jgi:hypothetical protein
VQAHDRIELDGVRVGALRTTWRCTWLLAGTSMTTSASTVPSRQAAPCGQRRRRE